MNTVLNRSRSRLAKGVTINIGWLFIDRIFRMGTAMLVGVWVARYLGPEQYGLWSYAFIFPTTLATVAGLGLTNTLVTRLVQQRDQPSNTLLGTAFGLKLVAGSVCYVLITAVSYWLNRGQAGLQVLILLTSTTLVFQSFDVIDLFFQARVEAKRSVWAKTIAFAVGAALKVYCLLVQASLIGFGATVLVEGLTGASLLVYFYGQRTGPAGRHWQFSRPVAADLLRMSWPLMLSEMLIYVYMRVDQFMIHALAGNAELGRYTAALRISESWYFVAGAITSSFYPGIVAYYQTDQPLFYERYQRLLNRLAAVALTVALGTSLAAPLLTNLLFGRQFGGVAPILAIHVWAGLPVYLGVGVGNLFIVKNLQKVIVFRTLTGALANVGLNLWLIPAYGAVGASVATLIAQLTASYLANALTPATRPIFRMQTAALRNVLLFRFNTYL